MLFPWNNYRAYSTPWSQTIPDHFTPLHFVQKYIRKVQKESIPFENPVYFLRPLCPKCTLITFFSLLLLAFKSEQTSGNISLYVRYIYFFFQCTREFSISEDDDGGGGRGWVSVFLSWSIGLIKWIWALWREIGWMRLTWLASDVGRFHVKLADIVFFEQEHGMEQVWGRISSWWVDEWTIFLDSSKANFRTWINFQSIWH